MATQYQKIPVPGYVNPTADYTEPEILYSTAAFTQKGVTIAAGQGVLAAGTVLGRKTADKKYYAYSNALADGREQASGVLRRAVDTGLVAGAANDQLGNMVIMGILKLALLVGNDAAAMNELGAVKDDVRGTFKF